MHLTLLLDMLCEADPDRAVIGPLSAPVTASMLRDAAMAVGNHIRATPAENAVFVGMNGWEFPALIFGAAYAGRPIAPLNYRLPEADLRKLLARTAPAFGVVDADMMARAVSIDGVDVMVREEFAALCCVRGVHLDAPEDEDDPIALTLFTSGTTGEPKAAILRHRHLTSYVISSVEFLGADADEAALVSVPPYHIAGVSAVLSNLYAGRRLVYMAAFDPQAWVETAARERITHAMVVPTMLSRIIDIIESSGERLPALRALSYGGGRMPAATIERALRVLPHVDFVNAYGLTETSSTIAVLSPEDHREAIASEDNNVRRRLQSVGRPLPTVEIEIRDVDGRAVSASEAGEIYVRGDQVAGEYRTGRVTDAEGWFATKDAGWLDADGFLYIDGRLDDVIVRGGENISPGEIEDVLRTHPGVQDVAVFGVHDLQWGEKVAAVVVRSDETVTEAGLADFVRTRLRSTKTPETWAFRNELPYNETGKLLRRVLKAEFQAVSA
ncbi:MAG: class I adenylate-forming enzyme family protein [Caulobacterales bacterium]